MHGEVEAVEAEVCQQLHGVVREHKRISIVSTGALVFLVRLRGDQSIEDQAACDQTDSESIVEVKVAKLDIIRPTECIPSCR